MNSSRARLRDDICQNFGDTASSLKKRPRLERKMPFYTFYSKKNNLLWCPVYKAASTSWIYNMMQIEVRGRKKHQIILSKQYSFSGFEFF